MKTGIWLRSAGVCLLIVLVPACQNREISNPVDPRFELTAPALLSASVEETGSISLGWEYSDGRPKEYRLLRKSSVDDSFAMVATVPGLDLSYTDRSVVACSTYQYAVQANWNDERDSPVSNSLSAGILSRYERHYEMTAEFVSLQMLSANSLVLLGTRSEGAILLETDIHGNQRRIKAVGDKLFSGSAVAPTTDGGFIVLGNSANRIALIKIDKSWEVSWSKIVAEGLGSAVIQSRDGGYVISGRTLSYNFQFTKVANNGGLVWNKTLSGTGGSTLGNVREIADGYVFVGSNSQIVLTKIAVDGEQVWSMRYGETGYSYHCRSFVANEDGSFVLLATISGTFDRAELFKVAGGKIVWSYSHVTGGGISVGMSVQKTRDGGYVAAIDLDYDNAILIFKVDSFGQQQWSTTFGNVAVGKAIAESDDGDIIMVGRKGELSKDRHGLLAKIGPDGNVDCQ